MKVTVTVIANHFSDRMYVVGETREVSEQTAAVLKRDGMVDYEGSEAPAEKVERVLVSDKKESLPEKVEKLKNGKNK